MRNLLKECVCTVAPSNGVVAELWKGQGKVFMVLYPEEFEFQNVRKVVEVDGNVEYVTDGYDEKTQRFYRIYSLPPHSDIISIIVVYESRFNLLQYECQIRYDAESSSLTLV